MELKFTVRTKIQKPLAEVFSGVHDSATLSQYFTTGGASGPLDEGTTVIWRFADHPGDIPVRVKKVERNRLIAFEWGGEGDTPVCRVELTFEPRGEAETLVSISESGWPETQKGLDASYGNCMGWSQMVSALKAWLEYGINLRKGAY
ncbi:MAG TPA: SRPBCC domain-containing protein [Thermoanaerobaculia bacterium]|nr:SRPBCC domain-containing protein [Thermoanaerobaculia bacterium]